MRKGPILVVPAFEEGRGGGHLVRSAALVRELLEAGREAWLYLPGLPGDPLPPLVEQTLGNRPRIIREGGDLGSRPWELIVLDRYRTPPAELRAWAALAPVLGIDEGGAGRGSFDFLLDLLPGLPGPFPANEGSPALLPLPKNRRSPPAAPPAEPLKILVSFGAEDPAGLGPPVLRALLPPGQPPAAAHPGAPPPETRNSPLSSVRSVRSVRSVVKFLQSPLTITELASGGVPELRESLAGYDLVITHFGLTAFEALHAGAAVLLVSPGAYHERLAKAAGFVSAGTGKAGARRVRDLVYRAGGGLNTAALGDIQRRCGELAERYGLRAPQEKTLGAYIGDLSPRVPRSCPACGAGDRLGHRVLARFPGRTYRRCPACKTVYMLRSSPPPIEYETDYFFGFYKKQYGKTYLEDFANLKNLGKERIRRIRRLLPGGEAGETRLLDIGCAYGPFLAAAGEAGFAPAGIDPAEDAVRYVREKLRLPAFRGFFPDPIRQITIQDRSFSVISLWYVIEHFEDLRRVLREINRLLKPGGVLAFSSPSFGGISARKSPAGFLERSPPDHWTVLDPRHIRPLLARYGFRLRQVVVTGHHPERFPGFGGLGAGRPAYRLLSGISRLGGLGDTFEVYAIKTEEVQDDSA